MRTVCYCNGIYANKNTYINLDQKLIEAAAASLQLSQLCVFHDLNRLAFGTELTATPSEQSQK